MKAYVITILQNPRSVAIANRCIQSGAEHGVTVEHYPAVTPDDDPEALFARRGFPITGGRRWGLASGDKEAYSRWRPVLACFLSHASIWARGEECLILEHDAVFRAPLPDLSKQRGVCNLGKPSFGKFSTPVDGFGMLVSKPYFGGAHGYHVHPKGAEELIRVAHRATAPTDVFLHSQRFPWLTEYHPWPIVCDDSFSTIQLAAGCRAKHQEVKPIC